MLPFAYYLFKVVMISAVLFSYYWFFLRNKVFHVYNRFYLLAIIVLSLTLPVSRINIFSDASHPKTRAVKMLEAVNEGDDYAAAIVINSHSTRFSFQQALPVVYLIISAVFFILLVQMLIRIRAMLKRNKSFMLDDIRFINTDASPGTPFSFFKNIFWNSHIDMYSSAGKKIFRHELSHIREGHSADKLFINMVLIVFWINPLFWLIRKELNMIHEFTADRRAVGDGDTASFAEMILATAYPKGMLPITNNFFYSPIKRRLAMLTKNQHPGMNYISRLLVLPLAVLIFAAFVLKSKTPVKQALAKTTTAQNNNVISGETETVSKNEPGQLINTAVSFTGNPITVVIDPGHGGKDPGGKNEDGTSEKDMSLELSKLIKALNANENVKIILSRETDLYQSPAEKAELALLRKADLFISLHLDAAPTESQNISSGMSVIISKDNNQNNAESRLLASAIIGRFRNNYGISVNELPMQRKVGVLVLEKNILPSVIIEAGYITNNNDLSYLKSNKGQQAFATNILNAINDFADRLDDSYSRQQPEQDSLGIYKGQKITGISAVEKNNKSIFILRLANGQKVILSKEEFTRLGLVLPEPPPPPPPPPPAAPPAPPVPNNLMAPAAPPPPPPPPMVFTKTDQPASFPGGPQAFKIYLQKNLHSDVPLIEKWKPGVYKVIVKFIVDTDGRLFEVGTENYIGSNTAKECIAVLRNGPKWLPAKQNGKAVNSYMKQPITFVVTDDDAPVKTGYDPVFRVGNLTSSRVKLNEFVDQKELTVTDGFSIAGLWVYFSGEGFPDVESTYMNSNNLISVRSKLDKCKSGSVVTFTKVTVKDSEGVLRLIDEKSYSLY